MDKNTWIGFLIIAVIIIGFTWIQRPSKEQLAERQRIQDSLSLVRMAEAEAQRISDSLQFVAGTATEPAEQVSAEQQQERMQAAYGTFAQAAQGEEQWVSSIPKKLTSSGHSFGG